MPDIPVCRHLLLVLHTCVCRKNMCRMNICRGVDIRKTVTMCLGNVMKWASPDVGEVAVAVVEEGLGG